MNAAIETTLERAYRDTRFLYYLDPWFKFPILEMTKVGIDYPVFTVLLEGGYSKHLNSLTVVYREDKQ